MECDICSRQGHQHRLPLHCAVDVRNQLYEGRLALADALMENERLEAQVDALATASASSSSDAGPLRPERFRVDIWRADERAAVDRTNEIIAKADKLRAEVDAARREAAERKEDISRRRATLAAESAAASTRRTKQLGESERTLHLLHRKWDHDADSMAATRGFLCMEAGKLYGLRRVKKGSAVHYEIGGLEIMDLASMNMLLPEVISTCLTHITHILMLASHYMAIRLPAEITLPHRDYPRPTIFTLQSSYKTRGEISFPGTSSVPHQPTPGSRDGDGSSAPRPRPLFVDKPLLLLAKEDPVAHKMFIEGVALLAYNVAWACCSQGVPVGGDGKAPPSPDDIFHLGRNLYNLLIGGQLPHNPAGRLFPRSSDHPHAATAATSPNLAPPATVANDSAPLTPGGAPLMGRYSHGTAYAFLGDNAARAYRLPNPKSLTDRLRARLSSDGPVADWEVLEDDAWAGADDADADAMEAAVQRRPPPGGTAADDTRRRRGSDVAYAAPNHRLYGVESVATVRTGMGDTIADVEYVSRAAPEPPLPNGRAPRGLGLNGWTKLKPR